MKKIGTILGAFAVFGIIASIALANTERLGAKAVTFHPTASVTKTAAYTITSSDSLVNVTCSSANITVTLPTIASLGPGTKSFKVLKTDSTTYSVIVAAATGDTIGGESSRYIVNQNGYIVITTGPNNDWNVDFESPYVVEDHAAGSSDLGTQGYDASIVFEGSTADDYETTLTVTDPTADRTITVPNLTGTVALTNATQTISGTNTVTGAMTMTGNNTFDAATGSINTTFANESGFLITNNHGIAGRIFVDASTVTFLPR